VPVSILVDRIFTAATGHAFLTPAEAEHGVRMLFPHASGTIFFAVVTGVFLWLSSLATGWTANYLAMHRMAESIANSLRIRERLGTRRAETLAHWVRHHAAGSVGFVVLGFLLGTMPIVFSLFAVHIEVRHVTLAAASLGYALDARLMSGQLTWSDAGWAFSGVAFVGVLNIATSFALSYLLAARARSVGDAQSHRLLKEVWRELRANPLAFVFPQRWAISKEADMLPGRRSGE
jgi:site-specific recombinase